MNRKFLTIFTWLLAAYVVIRVGTEGSPIWSFMVAAVVYAVYNMGWVKGFDRAVESVENHD